MKRRLIQFVTTYFLFVLIFVLQKPIFMGYYHTLYNKVSWTDYFSVMGHGLPLDFSLAGYLTEGSKKEVIVEVKKDTATPQEEVTE